MVKASSEQATAVAGIPAAQLQQLVELASIILRSRGGKARAAALSPERRKEIARMGGAASSMARRPLPKINPELLKELEDA